VTRFARFLSIASNIASSPDFNLPAFGLRAEPEGAREARFQLAEALAWG
jgi:hypothetical protein